MDTLLSRELLKSVADGAENASVMVSCLATSHGRRSSPMRAQMDSVYWAPADSQAITTLQPSSIQLTVQSTTRDSCDRSYREDAEGKVEPLEV